jgi:hypothetical protein
VDVSVSVAGPVKVMAGVQDAPRVVAFGAKVPPAPLSDQSTAVVPLVILPPRAAKVLPWQIVVFDPTVTH